MVRPASRHSRSRGADPQRVDAFVARWVGREGGQERANYVMFLRELCDALELPPPEPAGLHHTNDYVFERVVVEAADGGKSTYRRIDLYKRDCFILEAKQSRRGRSAPRRRPAAALMRLARRQALHYVGLLPPDHRPPPFLILCDVGRCFETYACLSPGGRSYEPFPEAGAHRIALDDLRQPAAQKRLRAIWTDPVSILCPLRHQAA